MQAAAIERRLDEQRGLRQSNIELLRIVAMVMIVAHHNAIHSGFGFSAHPEITMNRLWVQFLDLGGKIGANVFVLISGYFLIMKESIKSNKILKLWGQVFFYSFTLFLIFVLFGVRPFHLGELVQHLAPITANRWWFVSAYFVLYLLVPYLNKMLRSFSKKQYAGYLVLLLIMWSVIPTFTGQLFQSNYLLWFITLYSAAGYIRLFGVRSARNAMWWIGMSLIVAVLTYCSAVILDVLTLKHPSLNLSVTYFYGMQMLPVLAVSVLMFIGFSRLRIGYSRYINVISSATFGVYLIHDHDFVRPFLWGTVFQNASYADSKLLIPYTLFEIAIVFAVCTLLELARSNLLEKHYLPWLQTHSEKLDHRMNALISKIV